MYFAFWNVKKFVLFYYFAKFFLVSVALNADAKMKIHMEKGSISVTPCFITDLHVSFHSQLLSGENLHMRFLYLCI